VLGDLAPEVNERTLAGEAHLQRCPYKGGLGSSGEVAVDLLEAGEALAVRAFFRLCERDNVDLLDQIAEEEL
jgi:hypothetical protein